MLATIRKILAVLDLVMLVLFMVVFGILLYSKTALGAIVIFALTLGIIIIKYKEYNNTCPRERRKPMEEMMGNPLVDCALGIYAIQEYLNTGEWSALYTAGFIMVCVDLLFWMVCTLDKTRSNQ